MPPSAEKRGDSTRTSPARSPSRGQDGRSGGGPAPVAPLTLEAPVLVAVAEFAKPQEVPAS